MLEYKGKQVLISDILHDAADIFLRYNRNDKAPQFYRHFRYYGDLPVIKERQVESEKFSCCAVQAAVAHAFKLERWSSEAEKLSKKVHKGLRAMGCPTGSSTAFQKHGDHGYNWNFNSPEVQGMRYFWLKWAALMAQEQGV